MSAVNGALITAIRVWSLTATSYSILPALSLDGILHLHIQNHSYRGDEFIHFIDALMDQMGDYPAPNSVIVLDNASIHKSQALIDMVEAR